jgi:hypothetical protein
VPIPTKQTEERDGKQMERSRELELGSPGFNRTSLYQKIVFVLKIVFVSENSIKL